MQTIKLMLEGKELKVGDYLTEKDGFQYGKIRFINRLARSVEMIDEDNWLAWELSPKEGNLGKLEWKEL